MGTRRESVSVNYLAGTRFNFQAATVFLHLYLLLHLHLLLLRQHHMLLLTCIMIEHKNMMVMMMILTKMKAVVIAAAGIVEVRNLLAAKTRSTARKAENENLILGPDLRLGIEKHTNIAPTMAAGMHEILNYLLTFRTPSCCIIWVQLYLTCSSDLYSTINNHVV